MGLWQSNKQLYYRNVYLKSEHWRNLREEKLEEKGSYIWGTGSAAIDLQYFIDNLEDIKSDEQEVDEPLQPGQAGYF